MDTSEHQTSEVDDGASVASPREEAAAAAAAEDTLGESRHSSDVSVLEKLVRDRSKLKSSFTRVAGELQREFAKRAPSLRYLARDLQEAEQLDQEIRELVTRHREILESRDDDRELLKLDGWDRAYRTQRSFLSDVSSYVEREERMQASTRSPSVGVGRSSSRSNSRGTLDLDAMEQMLMVAERAPNSDIPGAIGHTSLQMSNKSPVTASAAEVHESSLDGVPAGNAGHSSSGAGHPAMQTVSSSLAIMSGRRSMPVLGRTTPSLSPLQVNRPGSVLGTLTASSKLAGTSTSRSQASVTTRSRAPQLALGVGTQSVSAVQVAQQHQVLVSAVNSGSVPSVPVPVAAPCAPPVLMSAPTATMQLPTVHQSVATVSNTVPFPSYWSGQQACTQAMPPLQPALLQQPQPQTVAPIVSKLPIFNPAAGQLNPSASSFKPISRPAVTLPVTAPVTVQSTQLPPSYKPPTMPVVIEQTVKPMELPKFSGLDQDYIPWRQRFIRVIHENPRYTSDHKLARLREAVDGGRAAEIVRGILDGPDAYSHVWTELDAWYGGSDRLIEHQIRDVVSQARITSDADLSGLQRYAIKLRTTVANLRASGVSPGVELYIMASEKVPKRLLVKYFERHGQVNDVFTFSAWLVEHVRTLKRAADRIPTERPKDISSQATRERSTATHRTFVGTHDAVSSGAKASCKKCSGQHTLAECSSFKALSTSKRWDLVRLLELCACCLSSGHWAASCSKDTCSKCNKRHHGLLHAEMKGQTGARRGRPSPAQMSVTNHSSSSTASRTGAGSIGNSAAVNENSLSTHGCGTTAAFMVLQADVIGEHGKKMKATVLLDSGSSCSYITEDAAHKLELEGPKSQVETAVIGGGKVTGLRQQVSVSVCRTDGDTPSVTVLDAWVLPAVTVNLPPVDWNAEKKHWSHLQDIQFPDSAGQSIDLLIGLNAASLHTAYEERSGSEGGPIARLTPLGWICFGPTPIDATAPQAFTLHGASVSSTAQLDQMVEKFWSLEAVGMQPTTTEYLSPAEKQAEAVTSRSLSYSDCRFQVAIPWKGGTKPSVQSNKHLALHRLESLQRALDKRPSIKLQYTKVLQAYLEKGYIRRVSEAADLSIPDQWHLPHFPVVRDDKTTTKVRVVFDAAAKCNGYSINDLMHAGPNLMNNLVHVLLRFCLEPIAIAGDITEMFLQVQLAPEDRKYHRFLWQSSPGTIDTFEFLRLVFGIKASPYLAGRALKQVAEECCSTAVPAAKEAIDHSFYVDDLLNSQPTEQLAISVRADLQHTLA